MFPQNVLYQKSKPVRWITPLLTLSVLWIFSPNLSMAQGNSTQISVNIPDVGLIAVASETGNTITLALEAPEEAGLPFTGTSASDSSLWLNYSSVVGRSKPKKDVYVKISGGSVPSGFALFVRAQPNNGNGNGNVGTSVGELQLSSSDQKIVDHIRTGYTGKGNGKGHRLVYRLEVNDVSLLDADADANIEITYTITDQ